MRVLALLLILFAAPLAAQTADAPISTASDTASDDRIEERLRDILTELGDFPDVAVTVNEGVVTLDGTVTSTAEWTQLDALAGRVEGVVAVRNRVTETTDVSARLSPAMERFRARVEQAIAFIPLALVALVVFGLIVAAGLAIARARQPWERIAPNAFIAEIYRQIVRLAFVILGLVIALDIVNATALLSTILGAAGIIGLALGFAVRDTVENFIASIMLSFRQPFRPNDAVEIGGDEGKVIRLTSRATILLSYDGNHIRIPNSTVFKSRIVNYTRNDERRILFEIGVASDCDLGAVRDLVEEVLAGLPFILPSPEPLVWIDRIGDGAIFLTVTGWIDQRKSSLPRARGEALRQVKNAIEAAGVEVPDTTYRVQMLGAGKGIVTESADAPAAPSAAAPAALEEVADVGTDSEAALDRLIHEERAEGGTRDLLDEDGKRE